MDRLTLGCSRSCGDILGPKAHVLSKAGWAAEDWREYGCELRSGNAPHTFVTILQISADPVDEGLFDFQTLIQVGFLFNVKFKSFLNHEQPLIDTDVKEIF